MAVVTKSLKASFDAVQALTVQQLTGDIFAGETLPIASPCYIKSDGKAYLCNGTAADAKVVVDGWTGKEYRTGEPVALLGRGMRYHYSDGALTPGQGLYLGTTAGTLDTAATIGGTAVVARAINTKDVYCTGGI